MVLSSDGISGLRPRGESSAKPHEVEMAAWEGVRPLLSSKHQFPAGDRIGLRTGRRKQRILQQQAHQRPLRGGCCNR